MVHLTFVGHFDLGLGEILSHSWVVISLPNCLISHRRDGDSTDMVLEVFQGDVLVLQAVLTGRDKDGIEQVWGCKVA